MWDIFQQKKTKKSSSVQADSYSSLFLHVLYANLIKILEGLIGRLSIGLSNTIKKNKIVLTFKNRKINSWRCKSWKILSGIVFLLSGSVSKRPIKLGSAETENLGTWFYMKLQRKMNNFEFLTNIWVPSTSHVRELETGEIEVLHIPSLIMTADVFIKAVLKAAYERLLEK